ncbi:Na+/H+ antiporter NhaC [Zobellella aerophila]|uniref:Na+/H+ antiporter NhaC n=1 Tax=Zobellella aerophila TaxID=870480 RepID=A0ABP6VMZ6_9GAMM
MTTKPIPQKPSFFLALLPIALTFLVLGIQLFYFNDFTPHIPLAIGIAITALIGWFRGYRWHDMEEGIVKVVRLGLQSVGILIIVGMIIGIWIASGTVPYLIKLGLSLLSPELFLAASVLICAVVSLSLGTSWGTTGTVGLALMGIGTGFDIPMYWTAGAVVSGAFFGDKMSPLSDTTNLAPAVTGVNLFDHIRNMLPTTIPAMLIALVIYLIVGFNLINAEQVDFSKVRLIIGGLEESFYLSWMLLLPLAVTITLAVKKMPALPTLFVGAMLGGIVAIWAQGVSLQEVFQYMFGGYKIDTGIREIDSLLNRGGIQSMTWVITLMLIALAFGGILEHTKCLEVLVDKILSRSNGFAAMQSSAIATSAMTNVIGGDPYLSIALPGRMFAPAYRKKGYSALNLSRATEEGGTLVSPLIPWNAGGAVVITALGLGIAEGQTINLLYIPLAFACWLSPLIGMFYAHMGWFSPRASADEITRWQQEEQQTSPATAEQPLLVK